MTDEQIQTIQTYQGDIIEEYWKPGPFRSNRTYVDLFSFWKFRENIRACGLEHLRSTVGQCISRKVIFKHERLASYYYSAYCRTASMHQCISDLEDQIIKRTPLLSFYVQDSFESFYLFLGSALDNIGGVGNIMLGYTNSEDSFSDFVKSFRADNGRNIAHPNAITIFDAAREINENYRAQIAHRGRLATFWGNKLGVLVPFTQAEFEKTGPATESLSWRKDLREMLEGRRKVLPMTQLCSLHLRTIEKAIDELFRISVTEVAQYVQRNDIKLADDSSRFDFDSAQRPADARWVLFRCNEENRLYLNIWFHDLSKGELPKTCVNDDCKSNNIVPMYYVKE
jgi:hypothetical protein